VRLSVPATPRSASRRRGVLRRARGAAGPPGAPGTAPGPPPEPPEPGSPVDRAIPPGIRPAAGFANRRDILRSDIPSGGTMTARGRPASTPPCSATSRASSSSRRGAGRTWRHRRSRDGTRSWASRRRGRSGSARTVPPASRPGRDRRWAWSGRTARPYADIDSGVAVAVMRNRFGAPGLAALAEVDRIVADAFPAPSRPDHR
jgi:hypothetical protein